MLSSIEKHTVQAIKADAKIIQVKPTKAEGIVSPKLSGAGLLDALGEITNASIDNPYVLKLDAGIYDLGVQTLRMKPFVDIEGSGQEYTSITSKAPYQNFSGGTIEGADFAELRHVTVINANPSKTGSSSGITNFGVSPKLTQVTCIANGPFINYSIVNKNSLPVLTGVTVKVSGFSN